MKKDIIIIGGGLGGLFCGAILAKEGCRVTVFEKNRILGGGLQSFSRYGHSFDTGMHVLGGFTKGGSLYKICRYLGILEELSLKSVDDDCMDYVTYFEDGKSYRLAQGRENFTKSLISYFPSEAEGIREYVGALYDMTEKIDFFHLREGRADLSTYPSSFYMPVNKLLEKYISDKRLQALLAYLTPTYNGVKGHTPAYIHALISVLYINGSCRFVDGSYTLANSLAEVICRNGGAVYCDNPVEHIAVEDKLVKYVEAKDGKRYVADSYISSVHPCSLLDIIDKGAFSKAYANRLNQIPNTDSAFIVYLIFKEKSFRYINYTCYCQEKYEDLWELSKYDESWPRGFMYMTPPVSDQGEYTRKMIITVPMKYEAVKQWEDSSTGNREQSYQQWKEQCAGKVIDKLARIYPDIKSVIERVITASPLTIRDYYNVKEGAMYGFRKDCENILLSYVPMYTKLSNMYLAGQNINLHGICGVPLTSVSVAETIIGDGKIVNNINNEDYGKN